MTHLSIPILMDKQYSIHHLLHALLSMQQESSMSSVGENQGLFSRPITNQFQDKLFKNEKKWNHTNWARLMVIIYHDHPHVGLSQDYLSQLLFLYIFFNETDTYSAIVFPEGNHSIKLYFNFYKDYITRAVSLGPENGTTETRLHLFSISCSKVKFI